MIFDSLIEEIVEDLDHIKNGGGAARGPPKFKHLLK